MPANNYTPVPLIDQDTILGWQLKQLQMRQIGEQMANAKADQEYRAAKDKQELVIAQMNDKTRRELGEGSQDIGQQKIDMKKKEQDALAARHGGLQGPAKIDSMNGTVTKVFKDGFVTVEKIDPAEMIFGDKTIIKNPGLAGSAQPTSAPTAPAPVPAPATPQANPLLQEQLQQQGQLRQADNRMGQEQGGNALLRSILAASGMPLPTAPTQEMAREDGNFAQAMTQTPTQLSPEMMRLINSVPPTAPAPTAAATPAPAPSGPPAPSAPTTMANARPGQAVYTPPAKATAKTKVPWDQTPQGQFAIQQAQYGNEDRTINNIKTLPPVVAAETIRGQVALLNSYQKTLEESLNSPDSQAVKPVMEQAINMSFNKLLDPNSVVRESEYGRSEQGLSFFRDLDLKIQKLGGWNAGTIAPEVLREIINEFVPRLVDGQRTILTNVRKTFEPIIQQRGMDGKVVFSQIDGLLNEYGAYTTKAGIKYKPVNPTGVTPAEPIRGSKGNPAPQTGRKVIIDGVVHFVGGQ
jgi:hypothetical protein